MRTGGGVNIVEALVVPSTTPTHGHFVLSPVSLASRDQDGFNDRQLLSHGKIGDSEHSSTFVIKWDLDKWPCIRKFTSPTQVSGWVMQEKNRERTKAHHMVVTWSHGTHRKQPVNKIIHIFVQSTHGNEINRGPFFSQIRQKLLESQGFAYKMYLENSLLQTFRIVQSFWALSPK